MSVDVDLYKAAGGDAAWQMWFDRCSVHRVREVSPGFADGLATEIDSAMYGQLAKLGIPKETMGDDVPHVHFDSFFLADSKRKEANDRKPLKSHYKYRLLAGDRSLKEFVCGTIFSPTVGRIRDVVRDWICTVRGWKPHSIKGADRKRTIVWERAAEEENLSEKFCAVTYRFGAGIDRKAQKGEVCKVLAKVSEQIGVEKKIVAFLYYTAAHDISLDNPVVLEVIGSKKSKAYNLRNKCLKLADELFRKKDVATDDVMFAQTFLHECEENVGAETLAALCESKSKE